MCGCVVDDWTHNLLVAGPVVIVAVMDNLRVSQPSGWPSWSEKMTGRCGSTPSGLARAAQFTDAVLALVRQALQPQAAQVRHMEDVAASMRVRVAQLADEHKATGSADTQWLELALSSKEGFCRLAAAPRRPVLGPHAQRTPNARLASTGGPRTLRHYPARVGIAARVCAATVRGSAQHH